MRQGHSFVFKSWMVGESYVFDVLLSDMILEC